MTEDFTPSELELLRSIRVVRRKTGISRVDLLDCFPDWTPKKLSKTLDQLIKKSAIWRVERGMYSALH